jgi:DNA gyrase subunit A
MEKNMEIGIVKKTDITSEVQQSYLDYAMSVIISRALPDARDGLKPVHRRILYAMYDMGLRFDSNYKKSARIVGEVLGKYHPHGDMAVYDAMSRMAQDFSLRYRLVDGQGNFGSVDGDPPAAMRYTEARMTEPAIHMLLDIEKETVDFVDNFDGTLREPTVLPAAIPNLLVNGITGIAVGMSTSIPPHNLDEVVKAMQYLLSNWNRLDDIHIEDIMKFIPGPDFPTGGIIIQDSEEDGLISSYSTGRGRITVQARVHLEEMDRGRKRIIVSELPYMSNKSTVIEKIADLVRESKIEGILDLRDESDRQGMRIVIELSKNVDHQEILKKLYKYTPLQSTFSIIMLALVDGEPRLLSLKQALRVYLEHRLEIVRKRSEYELRKARERLHILEGLRIAIKNLDEIIALIRRSHTVESARNSLMRNYKLSEIQAQAILDMPLRRLASLERKKIEDEYQSLKKRIKELEAILKSEDKMRQVVHQELGDISKTYADRRRTHIVELKEGESKVALLTATDLVPDKSIWISLSEDDRISRTLDEKMPRISGRETPRYLVNASTRHTLYIACQDGETAAIPVHAIPEAEKVSDGIPISKISPLRSNKPIVALFTLPSANTLDPGTLENSYILTSTTQGMIKKSALIDLPGASANTFSVVKINDSDQLGWVRLSNGDNDIMLMTRNGKAIRFHENQVRPMGLVAAGVMGIKLQTDDAVVGMELLPHKGEIFMVASDGSAKRVKPDQFPNQGRYGQGVVAWKIPIKTYVVGMTIGKGTNHASLQLRELAAKNIRLDDAPIQGRTARGKRIVELKEGDQIIKMMVPFEVDLPF